MKQDFCYEGKLLKTDRNKRYTQSLENLQEAMDNGIILEGVSYLCDFDRHLHIRLGDFNAVIPKNECVYTQNGLPEKDIAIISRVGKPVCVKITAIEETENGETL